MELGDQAEAVPPAAAEKPAVSAVGRFLVALEDATPFAEHHRIIRAAEQSDSAGSMASELNRIVQEIIDAP